jgi:uncharacterized membrane protein
MGHLQYFPLSPPFFFMLVVLFVMLLAVVQLHILGYAYERIGIRPQYIFSILLGSLLGSYINIPVAEIGGERIVGGQEIIFYGMSYVIPVVREGSETVIAVNVGGALIPTVLSVYLLVKHRLYARGLSAIAIVAGVCYALAYPVHGLGIALPVFVPPLVTTLVALALSWQKAAPLAYISGSLGTLIGADLLNLGKIRGLGAPVASIGGSGTFDGIFVTGILAVLLAGLVAPRAPSK